MATYLIGGRLVAGGGLEAGEITLRQLLPVSVSTELVLNDAETIDARVRVPLRDPATGAEINLAEQLVPGRDFVGVVANNTLMACGPLWADPFTTPGMTRLVAAGLWSYFDYRAVLPVLEPGQLPRDVTSRWEGLSLGTIAKRLVQQACAHAGAELPIDYEDDVEGDHEREYPGSDMMSVADALRNLTEVEGGPDIAFRPYITQDRRHVRWRLVTGDPELTQEGADWYWDVSAPGPHARVRSIDRDGRDLGSRKFMAGRTYRNEIENSSFEDGDNGWSGGSNTSLVEIVPSDQATHGAAYARWTATAAGVYWLDSVKKISVTEGEPVSVSVDMRSATTTQGRILLRFRDANDTVIENQYSPDQTIGVTPAWKRISYKGIAPAGASTVAVYIGAVGTAASQATAADSVMVTKSTEILPFAVDEVQIQAVAEADALIDAGFPLLEVWESRPSVLRPSTLQAYADEGVLRGSAHTENRALLAKRNAAPALGTYLPGDYALIRSAKTARHGAQTVRERIVRVSFQVDGDVEIELAPQRVVSGYPVPSSSRRWLADQLASIDRRIAETNRGV